MSAKQGLTIASLSLLALLLLAQCKLQPLAARAPCCLMLSLPSDRSVSFLSRAAPLPCSPIMFCRKGLFHPKWVLVFAPDGFLKMPASLLPWLIEVPLNASSVLKHIQQSLLLQIISNPDESALQ